MPSLGDHVAVSLHGAGCCAARCWMGCRGCVQGPGLGSAAHDPPGVAHEVVRVAGVADHRPACLTRRALALSRTACPASTTNQTNRETDMSGMTENSASAKAIRPFTVPVVADAELEALRARVAATRWPDRELVADHSQGVQLATINELARYLGGRIRLAPVRGETERPAALHDRDRRARHPLHPRPFRA